MPLDLTIDTFIPELTVDGEYDGVPLQYGCIIEYAYEHGRPGVSGEFSPESRTGNANHARVFVRMCDSAFDGLPKPSRKGELLINGVVWAIRIIRSGNGGVWELVCEEKGTRAVNHTRDGAASASRVRG